MRHLMRVLSLLVLLVVVVAACQSIGCRRAALPSVPFLAPRYQALPGEGELDQVIADFYLGSWQPESRALSLLSDTQVFRTKRCDLSPDPSTRLLMSWDGGTRLVLNAVLREATLSISDVSQGYRVDRVEPPMDAFFLTLSAPSDSDVGLLLGAYSGGPEGIGVVLEQRRAMDPQEPR